MYPAWFFFDAFILVLTLGSLGTAAVLAGRQVAASLAGRPAARSRRAWLAVALVVGSVLLVPAQLGLLLALSSYGPDFALERLPLGVPLALVTGVSAAAAVPGLWAAARGGPGIRPGGVAAVRVAAVGGLLGCHLMLVPPATARAVVVTGVAYAAVLGATLLRSRPAGRVGRRRRARVLAGGLAAVVVVAAWGGFADRGARAPGAYPALAGTPVDLGGGRPAGHGPHLPVGPGVRDVASSPARPALRIARSSSPRSATVRGGPTTGRCRGRSCGSGRGSCCGSPSSIGTCRPA